MGIKMFPFELALMQNNPRLLEGIYQMKALEELLPRIRDIQTKNPWLARNDRTNRDLFLEIFYFDALRRTNTFLRKIGNVVVRNKSLHGNQELIYALGCHRTLFNYQFSTGRHCKYFKFVKCAFLSLLNVNLLSLTLHKFSFIALKSEQ